MKKNVLTGVIICLLFSSVQVFAKAKPLFFCGSIKNDLYWLLITEGFVVNQFISPEATIHAASEGAGVFIVADKYPVVDPAIRLTPALLQEVKQKHLQLYIEYPAAFPGLDIARPVETRLERGVVTSNVFGATLPSMSVLGIHNCYVLPVTEENPLLVLAKVVGFDKAEYGLKDTKVYPLLFEKDQVLVATTALSNFERGRYGPAAAMKQVFTYILSRISRHPDVAIKHWPMDVRPMFDRHTPLTATARLNSIRKGVDWFYKGRFFVNRDLKSDWTKFGTIDPPVGPPVPAGVQDGNGSEGIIEGHTSTINYNGTQQYRYWLRADVQGEVSMALSAAGSLLHNKDYQQRARNLIHFLLETSNMRSGEKRDSNSAAYGLIAWATTNPSVYTFYGDDNSRAILGVLGAAAYQHTSEWDKEMAAAILANFRTTGKEGFRGERLEEPDIIKNGWRFYQNRSLIYTSPHFESWMWALYLWLYDKTKYEPLLAKTKNAIRMTMEAYPDNWRWGSSMQTQRARMILPLAWLVRVEDTPEHRQWLDKMVNEIIKYQDESGAIREELGAKGKGQFNALNANKDYGTDEGSLIYKNGEKVSCMLYTCNFALFSLNEAAQATGDKKYKAAVDKLSAFLTRIQVQSRQHPDVDGAWFRAFDYGRWDYWASNSDAGWGAWCTLSGWIQSWIVTSQIQIQQRQSYWEVTKKSNINDPAQLLIGSMLK
ncbi:hypothetical protein [Chitinophaga sp. RAB17]|uniref:hypothetical protein n=1 Tax=Chitinophaga sp. RAB17 TaxID=3233049 RepID=UPI003F8E8F58